MHNQAAVDAPRAHPYRRLLRHPARIAALQAAADKLSPAIIRKRLDYWTLILGPKFSAKERKQLNLSRFYAIAQIEYCRNFIFKRNFTIHKLLERIVIQETGTSCV